MKKFWVGFGIIMLLTTPYYLTHKDEIEAERAAKREAAEQAAREREEAAREKEEALELARKEREEERERKEREEEMKAALAIVEEEPAPKPTKTPEQKAKKRRKKLQKAFKESCHGNAWTYMDTKGPVVWKSYAYSSAVTPAEIAADYYAAFFESDDEVHVLVNLGLRTTAIVKKITGTELELRTYEYQKGDEHFSLNVGAGTLLSTEYVSI